MGNNSTPTAADRISTDRIIAARFGTTSEAEAVAQSMHAFIAAKDICIFHNNAPGQHGTTMFGDHAAEHQHAADNVKKLHATHPESRGEVAEEVAEQVEHAEGSAMATAAVAGVAAGVLAVAAGPVVALAAVGVAAYTGSLAGALEGGNVDDGGVDGRQGAGHHAPAMRQGGVMIAVHIVNAADQDRVVQALKAAGAVDIEQAEGKWQDGDWVDFDPLAAPELVKA